MAQQYPPPPPPTGVPTGTNGIALAGMICGIVSVLFAFLVALVGLILGILGVVFGVVGRNKALQLGVGQGQATAGIATGAVGILLSIVAYIIVFNNTF